MRDKSQNIARRTVYRLVDGKDITTRLIAFLNHPDAPAHPGYDRIMELLEIARQRRECGGNPNE